MSGCNADIKKAGCLHGLFSWIPVVPHDAVGLDVHFGPLAFTFQSYYTVLSTYIHLNRKDIICVTRITFVEPCVRKNSVF